MRKVVIFMHVSLDGFVAGPGGEMDWIHVEEEMFDYAGKRTLEADLAVYGRVTYQMMENYWPTAADKPNATRHDKEHSSWYNQVAKLVISRTLKAAGSNATVIGDHFTDEIRRLKKENGKNILLFGSPSVIHALMAENLIDDYWLLINPILLGQGIPLFKGNTERIKLELITSEVFISGVVCLHYIAETTE
jgi:dihydrofolate reductase